MSLALDPSVYPAYAAECGDPSRTKTLGFGVRPALLLVDVCAAYFAEASPLRLPDPVLATATSALARLLEAARSTLPSSGDGSDERLPVFFAQTLYTHPDLRDAGLLGAKAPAVAALFHSHNRAGHLTGPPSWSSSSCPELLEEHDIAQLQPWPDDLVLRKKYPSAFFGTNLAAQLAALGIDTLIIGGFATSGAVRATALDAMQAGFRPMVVGAACGDLGHETHWANLFDVGAKYSDVVAVEAAVAALGG